MTTLVSIALCTYNGEKHLEEQLNSLLNQTYEHFEIVVVDDASVDNTWEILRRYASEHSCIRLYQNDVNIGYNRNFERVLKKCRGNYIAICDQDDIWHPEKIARQAMAMEGNQMVYHDSELINEHGDRLNIRMSEKFNFYKGSSPEAFLFLNCVSGHSIMLKRSVLTKALPFPKEGHYDQWLAYVATSLGTIDYLKEALVQYRQHHSNATDLLSRKSKVKSIKSKISGLISESNWLGICSSSSETGYSGLSGQLFGLSIERNRDFLHLSYSWKIWRNRSVLLPILKKNALSKFFYCLRKGWGVPMKKLL
ncbi:glycosyltransferase family 2 protein [Dyadobacter tibetensis]|uniref:glycosyltransferase family 2 protein n=1 Tax=Dyadobacter tibetensis TaxID=1211851 RepID=UPI0004B604C4|nr:glycosyltransferase family 2 protein [Dyadobacter tibetensis]